MSFCKALTLLKAMALGIDTLRCSAGVAALRNAGCGVLRPVRVVEARRSG